MHGHLDWITIHDVFQMYLFHHYRQIGDSCIVVSCSIFVLPLYFHQPFPMSSKTTDDMAGGYKEDYNIQGHHGVSNAYHFIHWSTIDIFVYFSHSRVTIPPPMWITAAHINHTIILGTFITEWDDGIADNCKIAVVRLLSSCSPNRHNLKSTLWCNRSFVGWSTIRYSWSCTISFRYISHLLCR
jgi:hypothetical protein